MKRTRKAKIDGPCPELRKKIAQACRRVWAQSSYARKIIVKRAVDKDGFPRCEICHRTVPKIFVDHIIPVGDIFSANAIERLLVDSTGLQACCATCHKLKGQDDARKKRIAAGIY